MNLFDGTLEFSAAMARESPAALCLCLPQAQ